MWKRSFEPEFASNSLLWKPNLNGDGCDAMIGRDFSALVPHPWVSGPPFFAPENWAPTYDYPLICYLHDDSRSEQDLWRWFPAISDQNYLGVGIRAPFPAHTSMPGQYRWRGQRPDATAAVLSDAIETVQQDWNVHPDRIVLFGEGNGAVAALQQFMLNQCRSDGHTIHFSGVICRHLPGWWARVLPPVSEFAAGSILLLDPVAGDDDGESPAAIDGLSESGISVKLAQTSETSAAQVINHWVMSGVSTAIY